MTFINLKVRQYWSYNREILFLRFLRYFLQQKNFTLLIVSSYKRVVMSRVGKITCYWFNYNYNLKFSTTTTMIKVQVIAIQLQLQ